MIIGIDFDNTIIDYSDLFYEAGLSLGVLPENTGCNKKAIREYLIGIGQEDNWIRIQGLVYGEHIRNANVMAGFLQFSYLCYQKGWKIFIVSHKTRDSILGEKFNLHTSAFSWLEKNGIYGSGIRGAVNGVFFEATRSEKVSRINQLGCEIMIDDLANVLLHPELRKMITKILYDPTGNSTPDPGYVTAGSWDQIYSIIERHHG